MPKIILEFNTDERFEKLAAKRAANATEAYLFIYCLSELFTEDCNTIDREQFYDILDKYDINLNDIE